MKRSWAYPLFVVCCLGKQATAADPVQALEQLTGQARTISIRLGTTPFPTGGHWQGIQQLPRSEGRPQYCILSRDTDSIGLLITVALPDQTGGQGAVCHVQELPSDGEHPPLRHAGGIQRLGSTLVVGLEDNQGKQRSQIQFWDVSNPLAPTLRQALTIRRAGPRPKDQTAGAVGLVRRGDDHVLAVANWDARDLDFYVSNGKALDDDACRFSFHLRWTASQANRHAWRPNQTWGSYQAIHLLGNRDQQTYLLGFYTDSKGNNVVDLFAVDLDQPAPERLRKVASQTVSFPPGIQFRAAAGLCLDSADRWICYASDSSGQDAIRIGVVN